MNVQISITFPCERAARDRHWLKMRSGGKHLLQAQEHFSISQIGISDAVIIQRWWTCIDSVVDHHNISLVLYVYYPWLRPLAHYKSTRALPIGCSSLCCGSMSLCRSALCKHLVTAAVTLLTRVWRTMNTASHLIYCHLLPFTLRIVCAACE